MIQSKNKMAKNECAHTIKKTQSFTQKLLKNSYFASDKELLLGLRINNQSSKNLRRKSCSLKKIKDPKFIFSSQTIESESISDSDNENSENNEQNEIMIIQSEKSVSKLKKDYSNFISENTTLNTTISNNVTKTQSTNSIKSINCKRPNFLMKSCFCQNNISTYSVNKKDTSPIVEFYGFGSNTSLNLITKNENKSKFSGFSKMNVNPILSKVDSYENEDTSLIEIIQCKSSSSAEAKENSFTSDNNDDLYVLDKKKNGDMLSNLVNLSFKSKNLEKQNNFSNLNEIVDNNKKQTNISFNNSICSIISKDCEKVNNICEEKELELNNDDEKDTVNNINFVNNVNNLNLENQNYKLSHENNFKISKMNSSASNNTYLSKNSTPGVEYNNIKTNSKKNTINKLDDLNSGNQFSNFYSNTINNNFYNNNTTYNINNNYYQLYQQNMQYDIFKNTKIPNTINNIKNNQFIHIQNNNNIDYTLLSSEELARLAYLIAKNQDGCRYLENYIAMNSNLVPTLFFPYTLGYFEELSNHKFGNFYVKKLLKFLPKEILDKLIQFLYPIIYRIVTNQYGKKVIEQLIKCIKSSDELLSKFITILMPNIFKIINDLNGTNIIYKLLLIKSNYKKILENIICNNINQIIITREGNSLIKKYYDILSKNSTEQQKFQFVIAINNNFNQIINNKFGCNLIKYIIDNTKDISFLNIIKQNILMNLIFYSNGKYSSNVIEQCLDNIMFKDQIILELLKENIFSKILLNENGNYVIQKAIQNSNDKIQIILFKLTAHFIPNLQVLPFGQKLISKLLVKYPKLSFYILNIYH